MNRLTTHDENRQPLVLEANRDTWEEIYRRLMSYEDFGFEPKELDKIFRQWCLWTVCKAEGRLIEMPCNVNVLDRVFWKNGDGQIMEGTVSCISILRTGVILHVDNIVLGMEEYGETWFLTRDGAENPESETGFKKITLSEEYAPKSCSDCSFAEKHVTTISYAIRCTQNDRWIKGISAIQTRPDWCPVCFQNEHMDEKGAFTNG